MAKLIDLPLLTAFWKKVRKNIVYSGRCSNAADDHVKTALVTPKFALEENAQAVIYFENQNASLNPKLNVNATGVVDVVGPHGALSTANSAKMLHGYCHMIYNGENWVVISSQYGSESQIVYSESEQPDSPYEGMVWLKKKTTT